MTTGLLRLNVGAGPHPMPEYVNLDLKDGVNIDSLPYDDGTVDEIRASHVLEHVSHRKTMDVLRHWFAKLKPGGVVKIAVPNLEYIVSKLATATEEPLEGYLMGGHADDDDYHKAMFSESKLEALLSYSGFDSIVHWDSDFEDCSSLPVSLNMMATKPEQFLMENTMMLMSMPRYALTGNMLSVLKTVTALRTNFIAATGCFWGQCLERIMEQTIRENPTCEYLLTVDFDSVFHPDQVRALKRLMDKHELDAVFPVQPKREATTALMTAIADDGSIMEKLDYKISRQQLMRCRTGHFGLTLIRVAALKKLPKPWFKEVPDAENGWGDGHIDPDIWFWNQWTNAGLKLWQANRIHIGHAQHVVTWADRSWTSRHQYFNDWEKDGMPDWAR